MKLFREVEYDYRCPVMNFRGVPVLSINIRKVKEIGRQRVNWRKGKNEELGE